jgi:hypothetical protein
MNTFDINKFNLEFEQQQREQQLSQQPIIAQQTLVEKRLDQYTIGELLIEYKNSLLEIIDSLILFRYNNFNDFINIFNNNLLTTGITIIILAFGLWLFKNI